MACSTENLIFQKSGTDLSFINLFQSICNYPPALPHLPYTEVMSAEIPLFQLCQFVCKCQPPVQYGCEKGKCNQTRRSLGEEKVLNTFTQGFVVGECCLSDAVVVTHGYEGEQEERNHLFYMMCTETGTGMCRGGTGSFSYEVKGAPCL